MFQAVTKSKSLTVFALKFCCSPMWMKSKCFNIAYNALCNLAPNYIFTFLNSYFSHTKRYQNHLYIPCPFRFVFAHAIYPLSKMPLPLENSYLSIKNQFKSHFSYKPFLSPSKQIYGSYIH